MDACEFLADIERKPLVARALADRLAVEDPWHGVPVDARIILLGMGSSRYAASVAAARLRSRGVDAVAELASSDLLPQPTANTVVVAVSATGGSKETLDALDRLPHDVRSIALTNATDSALAQRCTTVVGLHAEPERGGVACRTFAHTLALLLSLETRLTGGDPGAVTGLLRRAADATEDLLTSRARWLPQLRDLVDGPGGSHLAAPARRLSSAQQSALMLREGPRRAAVACEAGDWAHVDVYLTKNTDYRLIVFAGSRWDAGIDEWTGPRGTRIAAIGGDFPGSELTVRFSGDDEDDVRLLAETTVIELVAADLWRAGA